jgi:hypothetical protein
MDIFSLNSKNVAVVGLVSLTMGLAVGCSNAEEGTSAGADGGSEDSSDSGASSTQTASDSNGSDDAGDTATTTGASGSSSGDDGSTGSGSSDAGTDADTDGSTTSDDTGDDTAGDTGTDDEGGLQEVCEAPGELAPCDLETTDPFQAIGLGCPGGPNESIGITNAIFSSNDPDAWKIARQYGTHIDAGSGEPTWGSREGDAFLVISSGRFNNPDADGVLTMPVGAHQTGVDNGNAGGSGLPAPVSPFSGSNGGAGGTPFLNCDEVNDCSDSLLAQWNQGGGDANDMMWFQFEAPVPGGTHGWSIDFAYFSAEFPEWVGTTFNDIFLIWSSSETYTGNICFVNDQPCTVTALWPVLYQEAAPELAGTGFDGNTSGSTGWFQAKGSAAPGELLQLTFAVFDMGDSSWDTAVVIDHFQWDCEGCAGSEVEPCIGIDPI